MGPCRGAAGGEEVGSGSGGCVIAQQELIT